MIKRHIDPDNVFIALKVWTDCHCSFVRSRFKPDRSAYETLGEETCCAANSFQSNEEMRSEQGGYGIVEFDGRFYLVNRSDYIEEMLQRSRTC